METYYYEKEGYIVQLIPMSCAIDNKFMFLITHAVTTLGDIHIDMVMFRKDFTKDVFSEESWQYLDFDGKSGKLVRESKIHKREGTDGHVLR